MQSNHRRNNGKRRAFCWGTLSAALALALAAPGAAAVAAPTETVLHSFTGASDGAFSFAGLIADSSGNLYGTTGFGGDSGCSVPSPFPGCGVVFKLAPDGTATGLHAFAGGSDGAFPLAGLIADSSGNLYGTTETGGGSGCGGRGCGVVFKVTPSGAETVLYSFKGGSDGFAPFAGLIADSSGNLYGTTDGGGVSGNGVVFKLTTGGTETVLYPFCSLPNCSDGAHPSAGLIADSSGNLYGTAAGGGASNAGTAFKLAASGTETVLYSFAGGSDGANPRGALIADSSGNLYGTTEFGGASGNGTVFKLTPSGTETVLYSFTGGSDGAAPFAGLIADSSGNLYGTTDGGGVSGNGVVFKLTPSGTETVLYSFAGGSDGAEPVAGLIADGSGNLYGTTEFGGGPGCGGSGGCGTVFKLAGTGFTTATPFSGFNARLAIQFGPTPGHDFFEIVADFTLGSNSNGIKPPAEPVTLAIGTFTTTIPSGSFQATGLGTFAFTGAVNGVSLEALIFPTGTKRYELLAAAQNADLSGTRNPVPVTLTIGDDSGTASVTAIIIGGVAAARRRRGVWPWPTKPRYTRRRSERLFRDRSGRVGAATAPRCAADCTLLRHPTRDGD